MQSKFVGVFPILAAILTASMFLTVAQSQAKEPKESKNITVTGCLEQGAGADQFNRGVEAEDGVEGELVVGVVALGRDVEGAVRSDGETFGVGLAHRAGEEDLLAGAPPVGGVGDPVRRRHE